jgi:ketosteroid isomerase-like protein
VALSVEDRLDLHELSARYAHAFDGGDAEAFAGLFADDAAFVLPNGTRVEGAEMIRELVASRAAEAPKMRHLITNLVVEETPGGARGVSYFYCVRLPDDGFRLLNIGRYVDEYTKTDGGWRFASRSVNGELAPELVDSAFKFSPGR